MGGEEKRDDGMWREKISEEKKASEREEKRMEKVKRREDK